jgi:hypothetical protein
MQDGTRMSDEASQENHSAMEHGDMEVRDGGIEGAPRQQSDSPGAFDESRESCTGATGAKEDARTSG